MFNNNRYDYAPRSAQVLRGLLDEAGIEATRRRRAGAGERYALLMRILSLVHGPLVRSEFFGDVVRAEGHELDEWSVVDDPDAAAARRGYDAVLVFGGQMNVDQEDEHPWLRAEDELVRDAPRARRAAARRLPRRSAAGEGGRRARRPVAGAGARLRPRELTDDAEARSALRRRCRASSTCSPCTSTRSTCPTGAVELARSSVCSQAFRLGDRAWGVQFHPEIRLEQIAEVGALTASGRTATRSSPSCASASTSGRRSARSSAARSSRRPRAGPGPGSRLDGQLAPDATTRATSRRSSMRRSRRRGGSGRRAPSASRCGSTRRSPSRLEGRRARCTCSTVSQRMSTAMSRLRAPGMWPWRGSHALPRVPSYSPSVRTSTRSASGRRAAARQLGVDRHCAATTSSSSRTAGRSDDLVEPRGEVRRQLEPEHVARTDHPRQIRDRREPVRAADRTPRSRSASALSSPRRNA